MMYRPPAYVVDDVAPLHGTIRAWPFATIARAKDDAVAFAYAPVVLDPAAGPFGALRFHLARANPLADSDGAMLSFSFRGPDSYVSPDWYETRAMVPTWNYVAVEAAGRARQLNAEDLRRLLVALSSEQEEHLRPKPPWRIEKVPADRLQGLLAAIVGFDVPLETLKGKFKLSQDKSASDAEGVIAGLEGVKRPRAREVANAMRETRRKRGN